MHRAARLTKLRLGQYNIKVKLVQYSLIHNNIPNMSVLQRLTLAGFRCFAPDNPQQVRFDKHLTVICGKAGSGKTALIQVIRFVVIGALPPLSDKGKNFATSPALLKQEKVIGEVQLCFSAGGGQPVTATRQIALTLGAKGGKFQSTRQAISWKVDGQTVEEKYERGEMDGQIVAFMGISRTVAEYVLFCHNEDSTWPFQGGAVLTNIFEELLTTSRYTKIVEEYRKVAAEKRKQVREGKKELEYLQRLYNDDNRKKMRALREIEAIAEEAKRMSNTLHDLTPPNMPQNIMQEIKKKTSQRQKILVKIQGVQANIKELLNQNSFSTSSNPKIVKKCKKIQELYAQVKEIEQWLVSLNEELKESEQRIAKKDAIINKLNLKMELAGQEINVPVHKEYIYKRLDLSALQAVATDLETQSNAIEESTLAFRRDKIAAVNKHLECFWREIYDGADITLIWVQINYETNRKLQGYCVMMEKGGQKIEMRGRCSDEQKCLASILLRLSLAEVFSPPSRIIALDQPGKGLSKTHIGRLGRQLVSMMQREFQLILITQDQQLLQMIEKLSSPTIYHLHHDQRGFSVLEMRSW